MGRHLAAGEAAEEASPSLREVLDAIQAVSERVDQHDADLEAAADLAHRQERAIGETRDEIDEVRADVDALTGEAGITDRALRGHIDDPRAHEHPDSDY